MRKLLLIILLAIGINTNAQTGLVSPTSGAAGYSATTAGSFTGLRFYAGNWKDSLGYYLLKSDTSVFAREAALGAYLLKSDTSKFVRMGDFMSVSEQVQDLESLKLDKYEASILYQPIGTYLTSESDPTVPSYAKSLSSYNLIKTRTDSLYKPIGYVPSWGEISGKPAIPTNTNQLTNGAGFISSFTELDPSVSSYTKSLTAFSVIKSSTDPLYRPISYVPSWAEITGKPSIKRIESYRGTTTTTGGNVGRYSITYATPFTNIPLVLPSIQSNSDYMQQFRIVSSTTSGFVIETGVRTGLSVLSLTVLSSAVTPTNGISVDVLVVEY